LRVLYSRLDRFKILCVRRTYWRENLPAATHYGRVFLDRFFALIACNLALNRCILELSGRSVFIRSVMGIHTLKRLAGQLHGFMRRWACPGLDSNLLIISLVKMERNVANDVLLHLQTVLRRLGKRFPGPDFLKVGSRLSLIKNALVTHTLFSRFRSWSFILISLFSRSYFCLHGI
jgi:hypothetical protein